ncbi:MAG: 30S ribosome-binding factor RbfA [Clostridia bacterium]|nr:30S ribosome-binding factor RbfA [Clostridia bacterium]
MPSNNSRMVRINEEVMRSLATLIRQVKDPRLQSAMISVIRCEVTNDLRWCKVYVSVLGEHDPKEIKKGLKSASGFLRRELAHSMSLRYTPELVFVLDDSIAYGAHIAGILNKLDIRSKDDTNDTEGNSQLS